MLHRYRTGLDDRQYGSRVEAMQCPLPRNPVQGNHKSRNVNRTLFLTFLSLISAGALQAQAGGNTSSTTTPGAVLNGTATLVGHYNSDQMLRLAIALRPPHFDEEQQLIKELHDKKSPQFHKFLTADEFNARFAPSVEDEQTVVDWARSQGLTITHRYPTRMVVDVQATAGTIEKALNITINNYQLGSTSFFSSDREPLLPANLTDVILAVLGLNSLEQERPASKFVKAPPRPDYLPGPVVAVSDSDHADADPSKLPASLAKALKRKDTGQMGIPQITDGAYDPTDIYSSQAYDYNAL